MMKRSSVIPMVAVMIVCPLTALAQQPVGTYEDIFRQLFPSPTGQNGYEELVKAGDVVRGSAAWNEMEMRMDQLTLAEKRRLMSDPEVKKALNMLRFGIGKPVTSPHKDFDDETRLPEFARFRSLARLVSLEMYVQLADGKTNQAIDTLADTLRFGYVIQTDTLIGGLVGIAVDAIGMRMVSDHLDQFSARDCDRLVALSRQWLQLPDPLIGLIEGERDAARRTLQKYRRQPEKLFTAYTARNNSKTPAADRARGLIRGFQDNPGSVGAAFDQANDRLSAYYEKTIENLRKPVWVRADLSNVGDDGTVSGAMVDLIAPAMTLVSDRYGREQAQVQILGVHAAIRRYLWENNRLPGSLDELKLGRLIIDPFTGKPISYKRIDEKTYEISSIGPIDRSEGATPGSRVAIK